MRNERESSCLQCLLQIGPHGLTIHVTINCTYSVCDKFYLAINCFQFMSQLVCRPPTFIGRQVLTYCNLTNHSRFSTYFSVQYFYHILTTYYRVVIGLPLIQNKFQYLLYYACSMSFANSTGTVCVVGAQVHSFIASAFLKCASLSLLTVYNPLVVSKVATNCPEVGNPTSVVVEESSSDVTLL